MSITDELREIAAKTECANGRCEKLYRGDLEHIADRIDAEHERQCAESWMRGHDAWAAIDRSDEMAEHGWIRLPKDADGEYIHEHDKVDWRDHPGTWHKNALVVAVCSDGCYVMDDGMVFHVHASDVRHYKQSTVEDVLREMCLEIDRRCERGSIDYDELFAEYAAKLRLAKEGE